jgi:hypothetical protein
MGVKVGASRRGKDTHCESFKTGCREYLSVKSRRLIIYVYVTRDSGGGLKIRQASRMAYVAETGIIRIGREEM